MRMLIGIIIGVLLLLLGLAWAMLTQPVLPSGGSAATAAGDVSPERLAAHVDKLSTVFTPRDSAHPEILDRVAGYIATHLDNGGDNVSRQYYMAGGNRYQNVIAAFGPDAGKRLVVGAHYDAVSTYPGADDNASGVAGLIELARLLGDIHLSRRVLLVAYTLEEHPHFSIDSMGSAVHAASLKKRGVEVRTMISLEMLGYYDDSPGSQRFPYRFLEWFYPTRGDFIAIVGRPRDAWVLRNLKASMQRASPLPVYSIDAPRFVPGIDFSDHRSYWDKGYPALMVTDTAFYRNPNYHTARDTAGTLDYRRMAEVVEGVYQWVLDNAR